MSDGRMIARFAHSLDPAGGEVEVQLSEFEGLLVAHGAHATSRYEQPHTATGRRVEAYFWDSEWSADLVARLERLAAVHEVSFDGFELVIDQDWMRAHRALAEPIRVAGFVLDPSEPDDRDGQPVDAAASEVLLRVPARRAFGTGSHETTRLMLRLMKQTNLAGRRILDVGCGSGVLTFATHHLGAAAVVGFDTDLEAVVIARENQRLNDLEAAAIWFFAGIDRALAASPSFERLLVNVLPHKLEGSERGLASVIGSAGEILLSGLLIDDPSTAAALERWKAAGFEPGSAVGDWIEENEWAACRLQRSDEALR